MQVSPEPVHSVSFHDISIELGDYISWFNVNTVPKDSFSGVVCGVYWDFQENIVCTLLIHIRQPDNLSCPV